jgi:hypothetical protein
MQAKTSKPKSHAIAPRWLTFQTASTYAGVSEQTLRNWAKAKKINPSNVTPMGGRGRVLIDRIELDGFIESFAGAPPSEIAMNTSGKRYTGGRKSKGGVGAR